MNRLVTTEKRRRLLEEWTREGGLSGNALKRIACFFMFFDHLSQGVALDSIGFHCANLFDLSAQPTAGVLAGIAVLFGRIAFPIFCFFLVQGMLLTRDYKKQILRLVLFALISEIPFDLGLSGQMIYADHQNVMFTLALGAAVVACAETIEGKMERKAPRYLAMFAVALSAGAFAEVLNFDYGMSGIVAIFLFYLAAMSRRESLIMDAIAFIFEAPLYGTVYLSIPLINAYNGKRGRGNRYGFYLFYPGHLLLLYLLSIYI
ncbi:MAG: TraX family protein [Peptoniphilus sp.]|nr:TraX family protein [Peptoniphilus sp.]MDY6045174.1 TraX family protein [Peptoniphilus sp.]